MCKSVRTVDGGVLRSVQDCPNYQRGCVKGCTGAFKLLRGCVQGYARASELPAGVCQGMYMGKGRCFHSINTIDLSATFSWHMPLDLDS